ncbi:MAG: twin-arginine translocase TatA/TatE family subunit [Anaeromyxobacteraceae bacterium]
MFGLGFGEIIIILVLALVLLGPARLPDAAKSLGKAMRDFKKATDDVKDQFESAMYEDERRVRAAPPPPEPPPADAPPPGVPSGGIPPPAGTVPPATAGNVPGLEAALAEPAPRPAVAAAPTTEAPKA